MINDYNEIVKNAKNERKGFIILDEFINNEGNKINLHTLTRLSLNDLKKAFDMINFGILVMEEGIPIYKIIDLLFDNKVHTLKHMVYDLKDYINFSSDKYLCRIDIDDLFLFTGVIPANYRSYFLNHTKLKEHHLKKLLDYGWVNRNMLYRFSLRGEFSSDFIIAYKSELFDCSFNLKNRKYLADNIFKIFDAKTISDNLDIIDMYSVLLKNVKLPYFPLDNYKEFVKILVDKKIQVVLYDKSDLDKVIKNIYTISDDDIEFIETLYSIVPEYLHTILTIRICKNLICKKYINLSPAELIEYLESLGYHLHYILKYLFSGTFYIKSEPCTIKKYKAKDILGRLKFAAQSDKIVFNNDELYTINDILDLAKESNDSNKINIVSEMFKRIPTILPKIYYYTCIIDITKML